MPEESTTPDPVELTRHAIEVASRHDVEALMVFFAPDAVFDLSDLGIGTSRARRGDGASLRTGGGRGGTI